MSGESLKPTGPIPEFKGKGSYGCVLGPAIACVPGTEEGDKARALASPHVSKVFFSDDMKLGAEIEANTEYVMGEVLRVIDPKGLFTVQPDVKCQPNLQKDVIKKACSLGERRQLAEVQVLYSDGGMNLSQAVLEMPFMDVFKTLVSILSGLVKMNSGPVTYIHCDLTPNNMTLDVKRGVKFSKMIDFGLMVKTKELYIKSSILRKPYQYWPPEYDIIKAEGSSNGKMTFTYVIQRYKDTFPSGFADWYAESLSAYKSKLRAYLLEHNIRDPVDQANYIRDTFGSKFDVYGLGVSMLVLYATSVEKRAPSYVFDFIKGCADPNPYTRMTAKEALQAFLGMFPVLPDLTEYLSLSGMDEPDKPMWSVDSLDIDEAFNSIFLRPPSGTRKSPESSDGIGFRKSRAAVSVRPPSLGGAPKRRRSSRSKSAAKKGKLSKRRSPSLRKRYKSKQRK